MTGHRKEVPVTLPWRDPEQVFVGLAAERGRTFWLDGGGARPWSGGRSFVGWLEHDDVSLSYDANRRAVYEHRSGQLRQIGDDIFAELAARRDDGCVGWVGYLGYACRPDLPALRARAPGHVDPVDACWLRPSRYLEFDHETHAVILHGFDDLPSWDFAEPSAPPGVAAPSDPLSWSQERYADAFSEVQRQLRLGNSYEVNLTYRMSVSSPADPLTVYRWLRRFNPAPYACYLRHADLAVLCSSPERFMRLNGRRLETRPIKGTTPRNNNDQAADEALAKRLRDEPKFRAENLMVVDLLRNDLSIVCQPGTVTVPELMYVESYPSVHQLVSRIEGRVRPGVSATETVRSLFPGGSMTGAPKLRTMEIIGAVEDTPRGVYAGAIGWLLDSGRADLGIVIRTLVAADGRFTLGTGGAITVRSDLEEEFAETQWKAQRLLQAVGAW
jgi:anthranilate/para-aminobenzoate synthase component I